MKIGQLNESRKDPSHEQHYKQPSTTVKLIRGEGGIEINILVFSEPNNPAVVGIIIITTTYWGFHGPPYFFSFTDEEIEAMIG